MHTLNTQVVVRFTAHDYGLLKQVSELRREDVSDFVRRAVAKELAYLSYLPDDDKKALGV